MLLSPFESTRRLFLIISKLFICDGIIIALHFFNAFSYFGDVGQLGSLIGILFLINGVNRSSVFSMQYFFTDDLIEKMCLFIKMILIDYYK